DVGAMARSVGGTGGPERPLSHRFSPRRQEFRENAARSAGMASNGGEHPWIATDGELRGRAVWTDTPVPRLGKASRGRRLERLGGHDASPSGSDDRRPVPMRSPKGASGSKAAPSSSSSS